MRISLPAQEVCDHEGIDREELAELILDVEMRLMLDSDRYDKAARQHRSIRQARRTAAV